MNVIEKIFADEFFDAENLSPIRIVVSGPPASGKSFLGRKFAEKVFCGHMFCPFFSSVSVIFVYLT
jgi:hypothetical protein